MPGSTDAVQRAPTHYVNNSPLRDRGARRNLRPIKTVNGAIVYIRDVATVRDGNPPQTNIVHVDGNRSVLMDGAEGGRDLDIRPSSPASSQKVIDTQVATAG